MKKLKYIIAIHAAEDDRPTVYYVSASGGFTLDKREAADFRGKQAREVARKFQGQLELVRDR